MFLVIYKFVIYQEFPIHSQHKIETQFSYFFIT